MALKNGKPNPLNIHNLRKVSFPADHFHYALLGKYTPTYCKTVDLWIYHNLNSRYYIGQSVDLINNTIVYATKIGFEQEKELSFFKLACPHLS
jgi:hypothetical protein